MLARVLEPEVMDSADDAADYDAMDHQEVNRTFVSDFLREHSAALRQPAGPNSTQLYDEILDVGTGTAQIPIELCRQDPRARVVAVDLARSMLELARENVERAGLGDRIRLELADAKRLPYGDQRYRALISNSIVHHVAEPAGLIGQCLRVLAVGSPIFIRDLSRPSDEMALERLVAQYAGRCNSHQRKLFADSLRAAITVDEMRSVVAAYGYDRATVAGTSDRHWTWSARKR